MYIEYDTAFLGYVYLNISQSLYDCIKFVVLAYYVFYKKTKHLKN